MAFKVWEKVRVIGNLTAGETYFNEDGSDDCATRGMERFRNKVVTIKDINSYGYRILEDDGEWNWTDGMFKPYKDNKETLEKLRAIEKEKAMEENMTGFEKWAKSVSESQKIAECQEAQLEEMRVEESARRLSSFDNLTSALRGLRWEVPSDRYFFTIRGF